MQKRLPMLLPRTVGTGAGAVTIGNAQHPDLLVGAGKQGLIYLIDRTRGLHILERTKTA